ncbi:hypothetical protein B0H67DRAFT_566221 [Lasiosphaeris hirsuta]|uniref:Uncharacterized protein n=1 Tax=Lasiosphaeris hirsuta TaxID=260670 RepID=A0AA40E8A1_9PEZI|nr:hypothetical protein B0H67DRAFT_566221 [Lasiosphaeris hirsuta]
MANTTERRYVYGGLSFPPSTPSYANTSGYDDLNNLTVPTFQWIRAGYPEALIKPPILFSLVRRIRTIVSNVDSTWTLWARRARGQCDGSNVVYTGLQHAEKVFGVSVGRYRGRWVG